MPFRNKAFSTAYTVEIDQHVFFPADREGFGWDLDVDDYVE